MRFDLSLFSPGTDIRFNLSLFSPGTDMRFDLSLCAKELEFLEKRDVIVQNGIRYKTSINNCSKFNFYFIETTYIDKNLLNFLCCILRHHNLAIKGIVGVISSCTLSQANGFCHPLLLECS